MDEKPRPASETKHLNVIHHALPNDSRTILTLRQISGTAITQSDRLSDSHDEDGNRGQTKSTGTTGTTLWLGAQVLACYLSANLPGSSAGKRAIELGSGVGYLSLILASMGHEVIATDIEPVLSSVLRPNIEDGLRVLRGRGLKTGNITVRELDWEASPKTNDEAMFERLDMIVMSDTIYHPTLIVPLFQTIRRLCLNSTTAPVLYFALERRDSRLVDQALVTAREIGFELKRIGNGRVAKAVKATGWVWKDEDWAGVEVWKGKYAGGLKP